MTAAKRQTRSGAPRIVLRLYVAGESPNSLLARLRLDMVCRELNEPWQLDVVDVLKRPNQSVIVTPTLVRLRPKPEVRMVGSLSDREALRRVLLSTGTTS